MIPPDIIINIIVARVPAHTLGMKGEVEEI